MDTCIYIILALRQNDQSRSISSIRDISFFTSLEPLLLKRWAILFGARDLDYLEEEREMVSMWMNSLMLSSGFIYFAYNLKAALYGVDKPFFARLVRFIDAGLIKIIYKMHLPSHHIAKVVGFVRDL